ncbi:MAG: bifunctional sulfate adenylyltransferase/adenylylsulfate kinase [Acidobacteria bacterium]|nr:bifunctional sulfate adenylyltransferase/adenylylsulfate kinase [Acidobacteriota bacterium]MBV9479074.1 bifunctional sulfate adenylyltransferase/adenylylsulfate kinase [Acidobacteriota bacterium]
MELISPYGGTLVNLLEPPETAAELARYAATLPSVQLSERSTCDLELLATGAFSPLDRFLGQADFQRVLDEMRLAGGALFPIPVTLPVDASAPVALHHDVALRSPRQELLAVMTVDEIYGWDVDETAQKVFGTTDRKHPLVAEMDRWGRLQISGPLRVLRLPSHYDFVELRRTPADVRALLAERGRENVVAFQTRNPLHRAHEELTHRAIEATDGVLLLHPVVGLTKPGDIDHYTRVRTYKALVEHYYEPDRVLLSLLPLAMRMAGPREALWHAIIRRNFGANHFIVGRDHASPGPFYGPYDAQQLVAQYEAEIGVKMVPFRQLVYVDGHYEEQSDKPSLSLSGTQVREDYLAAGKPLPEWFTRPEVAAILAEAHPPRYREGFCLWFTGLSGAGKSTTADIVVTLLLEHGRQATVLDGDVVRTHLSKGLGFSKEDRDTNILRIGYVASEVVRHGGVAVCAAVSPYRATRDRVRELAGAHRFIEIFVDTPLDVCESRDIKGMYAQARAGLVKNFTGIDDPYEPPLAPELTLDTVRARPEENARRIVSLLRERGFLR